MGESTDESTDDVNSTTSDTNLQQLMATHNNDEHEPWPKFIKRATRIAEETTKQLNMQEWTTTYWKKKWKWANRISGSPTNNNIDGLDLSQNGTRQRTTHSTPNEDKDDHKKGGTMK